MTTTTPPGPGPVALEGPPFVHPRQENRPRPGALYLARDDRIYVRTRGSVAGKQIELRLRLQMPDGQVIPQLETLAVVGDRTTQTQVFDVAEGYLLGVAVQALPAPVLHGAIYVEVGIAHETVPLLAVYQVLVSGYVSDGDALGWPYGRPVSPLDGIANLRAFAGTNPAAGAEVNEAVPANASWLIWSLRVPFQASGAAANRRTHVVIDDGANILADWAAADLVTAGQLRNINASADGFARATQDSEIYVPIPPALFLRAGMRIRTVTTALDVGDDYGIPRLLLQEYLEA